MNKVVETGLKIDLHIHSAASAHKDGAKVRNNTLQNIRTLIEKLNDNEVNICSITDHDTFSYEMYQELKKAESMDNSIQKVLPGVEFSVCFVSKENEGVVHVVTIFNDEDDRKVHQLENILKNRRPKNNGSYKEEEFLELLREADMNTILIAHQKNTLSSCHTRKNDANCLGNQKFLEFVYTDYFEAFEFKNRRNEVLNKTYLLNGGFEQEIRFVTGTDCHDWSAYPSETPENPLVESFPYTFAKCLPTFKGLVMAITDHTRLKRVNSFFNVDKKTLGKIELKHNGQTLTVPLSRGINAIIGDNSIGKSLLLHALTGYQKAGESLPAKVKTGYKKYLKDNGLTIDKQLQLGDVFCFDMQGEVRSKFEENKLNASDFLKRFFPTEINATPYRNVLSAEITRMREYLSNKFTNDKRLESLLSFQILIDTSPAESITFLNNVRDGKQETSKNKKVSEFLASNIVSLHETLKIISIKDDQMELEAILKSLESMKARYDHLIQASDKENKRMEAVYTVIDSISIKHSKTVSDRQKKLSSFTDRTANLIRIIAELIQYERTPHDYKPSVKQEKVQVYSNNVLNYEFVSKLNVDEISTDYFNGVLSRTLKANKTIDWRTITESELKDMMPQYDGTEIMQFFQSAIDKVLDQDFSSKHSIIVQGTDRYAEMSSGMDSKIYFDLLCSETRCDGIYLIDQPEDNISQKAIGEYLLDRFKSMGEIRQVIMITHNPQFIVNLDVDNVVFLSKDEGGLKIISGALEYECADYNILNIVAQNIDGGLNSIRKRWKRYEKTADL